MAVMIQETDLYCQPLASLEDANSKGSGSLFYLFWLSSQNP